MLNGVNVHVCVLAPAGCEGVIIHHSWGKKGRRQRGLNPQIVHTDEISTLQLRNQTLS